MARTKIDIANAALTMVGADAIAAFDDGSTEGVAVGLLYENCVGAALLTPGGQPMRWSWATRQQALARLSDTPEGRWDVAWQLPALCLKVHAITENDANIPFAIYANKVFTNEHASLVCDHTFRVDESLWPMDFADAVSRDLAGRLAMALNENAELAAEIRRGLNWGGVRTSDSQQHTSRRLRASRLVSARFGRSGRWARPA